MCRAELRARGWAPGVEYVTEYQLREGLSAPPAPVLPPEFAGRPHDYLAWLNAGNLVDGAPLSGGRPGWLPYCESESGRLAGGACGAVRCR